MGHTNETMTIGLPQFVGDDKPTWLGDVNGAFQKIDSETAKVIANNELAVNNAQLAIDRSLAALELAEASNQTSTSVRTDAAQALLLANNALTVANNTATLAQKIDNKYPFLDKKISSRTLLYNFDSVRPSKESASESHNFSVDECGLYYIGAATALSNPSGAYAYGTYEITFILYCVTEDAQIEITRSTANTYIPNNTLTDSRGIIYDGRPIILPKGNYLYRLIWDHNSNVNMRVLGFIETLDFN